MKKVLIGIGLGVSVILGINLLFLGGSDVPTTETQILQARLQTLSRLLDEGATNASNAELRKLTADASILVASDARSLSSVMSSLKIKPASKTIIAAEANAPSFKKLSDAKLNGEFDTVYARVLAAKLDITDALMKEVISKSRSKPLDSAVTTARSHLNLIEGNLNKL